MNLKAASVFSLERKTALLTGATGFLGRTMARVLLTNGARVIALGRSERYLELAEEWSQEFGIDRVSFHQCDMYDFPAFENLLQKIVGQEECIDILINNAYELSARTGFNVPEGTLEKATLDQWMCNFAGGLYWPAMTVQTVGAAMKERGAGSIINISTMYAQVAPRPLLYAGTDFINPPGYSAAKAGLLAFTRYVASFWGPFGVRCNAILPGPFSNTQETGPNTVREDDPFLKRLYDSTCLRRIGRPEELAGALLFLASEASSFVTGHGLVVDGGWTVI